jgi:hypothetical protein
LQTDGLPKVVVRSTGLPLEARALNPSVSGMETGVFGLGSPRVLEFGMHLTLETLL